MSVNPISPDVFQGGQMTDLPVFTGTLDGTELMEIVAAPSGQTNEAQGVNYSITTALLAALIVQFTQNIVVIGNGEHETPGDPYDVQQLDARVYINKTVPGPTYIRMPISDEMFIDSLVADVAGTTSDVNFINVTFTGGELVDGLSEVNIISPYTGYFFRPIPPLNKWHLGNS